MSQKLLGNIRIELIVKIQLTEKIDNLLFLNSFNWYNNQDIDTNRVINNSIGIILIALILNSKKPKKIIVHWKNLPVCSKLSFI